MNRVVQSSEMLGLPKLKFTRQQTHNALASQGSKQQCQAQISYEKDGLSMPKIIQQQPGLKPTKPASIRLRGISLGKLTEDPAISPDRTANSPDVPHLDSARLEQSRSKPSQN